MIKVIEKNGEQQLHQWDTGRQLRVHPPAGLEVDEIHFQGPEDEGARRREVREENGVLLVDVPDLFLQSYGFRKVWAVCNGQTVHTEVIKIKPKQRPNDYVDPEDTDEVLRYSDLLARIEDLEENQQPDPGDGPSGATSEEWAVLYDAVLEEDANKVLVTEDMAGTPFKAKKLRVYFFGTVTDARLNMSFGGAMQKTYLYQAFIASKYIRVCIEIGEQLYGGICTTEARVSSETEGGPYTLSCTRSSAISDRPEKYISSVSLGLQADKYYKAGTRVIIEGVLE